jgi:nucleoside-diphosphate-sugar epimerase
MLLARQSPRVAVAVVISRPKTEEQAGAPDAAGFEGLSREEYERFPSFWSDATLRRWDLWGYVDARDVAQSCRLALEADVGAEQFIVSAADTVMNRPSVELMAEVYPSVRYRPSPGKFDTLLSIEKARKLLSYEPEWSWRDQIAD